MRKLYCDVDKKEITPDAIRGTVDAGVVALVLQVTDLQTGKTENKAAYVVEVCGLHRDAIVEEGHDVIKEFTKKVEAMGKQK